MIFVTGSNFQLHCIVVIHKLKVNAILILHVLVVAWLCILGAVGGLPSDTKGEVTYANGQVYDDSELDVFDMS